MRKSKNFKFFKNLSWNQIWQDFLMGFFSLSFHSVEFQDFSVTQVLREIYFGDCNCRTRDYTICHFYSFRGSEVQRLHNFIRIKIQSPWKSQIGSFELPSLNLISCLKIRWQKIPTYNFPYSQCRKVVKNTIIIFTGKSTFLFVKSTLY